MIKCEIEGIVTQDPRWRETESGVQTASCRVRVLAEHPRDGELAKETVLVTAWRTQAAWLSGLMTGDRVRLRGRAGAKAWQGKDGSWHGVLELMLTRNGRILYDQGGRGEVPGAGAVPDYAGCDGALHEQQLDKPDPAGGI